MSQESKKVSRDNQILKKHVAAIHIGAKLSLLQRKLVNALLYNAYDQLLTAQNHEISASVLRPAVRCTLPQGRLRADRCNSS